MRKLLTSVVAIVLATMMTLLTGCNLITTNDEKDLNQVIATVQISEDSPLDKVYKKDLAMAYLNYGYYYEQQGSSREDVIKAIVNNLTNTRVFVQNAVIKFDLGQEPFANQIADQTITDKWNLDRYLTREEIIEAEYKTKVSMNDLIESYMEAEDEKVGDSIPDEIRTVPTNATNAEEEVDKENYKVDTNSSSERRVAFNKAIKLMEKNSLLGNYVNDITETDYYQKTLKGNKEQALIEKYQKCIVDSVLADYDLEAVRDLYLEKLAEQKKWTDSTFATKLSEASASTPILYSPTGTYGFVYNLLLGVSEEQDEQIKKLQEDHPEYDLAQYAAARRDILDSTIAKDLRSTWIQSGYDFDGTKFTGDYAVAGENALPFKGAVTLLNADEAGEEDYKPQYGVESVTEFALNDFLNEMETYLYGAPVASNTSYADASVYKAYNSNGAVEGFADKVNELLFAFSTDPGSLNTYKGYLISPTPDGANTETYKDEFAVYGRELLELGNNSYIMVATDYGYHIMFYSQKYAKGQAVYADLDAYYDGECKALFDGKTLEQYFAEMKADWSKWEETDNFVYALYSEIVAKRIELAVSNDDTEVLNTYVFGENSKVVKYEDRYAEWLKA